MTTTSSILVFPEIRTKVTMSVSRYSNYGGNAVCLSFHPNKTHLLFCPVRMIGGEPPRRKSHELELQSLSNQEGQSTHIIFLITCNFISSHNKASGDTLNSSDPSLQYPASTRTIMTPSNTMHAKKNSSNHACNEDPCKDGDDLIRSKEKSD